MVSFDGVVKVFRLPAPGSGNGRRKRISLPDFSLKEGQSLLVGGSNGAGKTTLLNLAAGLLRVDEGSVRVSGVELSQLGEDEVDGFRARTVGMIPQRPRLVEWLTVTQNLILPMKLAGLPGRRARARAQDLLERFGLAAFRDLKPGILSGGELQRVCLAAALASDPAIVLADEPSSHLDPESTRPLIDLLVDACLAGAKPRCLIVVTHQMHLFPGEFGKLILDRPGPDGDSQ